MSVASNGDIFRPFCSCFCSRPAGQPARGQVHPLWLRSLRAARWQKPALRTAGQLNEAVSVVAGILTGGFSAGQVLRVPLLASGHRPVVHTSIARRALLLGGLSCSAAAAGWLIRSHLELDLQQHSGLSWLRQIQPWKWPLTGSLCGRP